MANWQTPKTDWVATDYYNIEDYERWVGNLLYLKELSTRLFLAFSFEGMTEEKEYTSMIYASEINAIENNLNTLNVNTYNLSIGTKMSFSANGNTPTYTEINRIEKAMLDLFQNMYGQIVIRPHLAITLGGQKNFGKRTHYDHSEVIAYRGKWKLSADRSIRV